MGVEQKEQMTYKCINSVVINFQLKGTGSPDEYIFEGLLNEISTFCTCTNGFNVLGSLLREKNN
jgi:hypothetical protein